MLVDQICFVLVIVLPVTLIMFFFFFFTDTATTEIYTLSLHDALPILAADPQPIALGRGDGAAIVQREGAVFVDDRSEEHTSELQSRGHLVCRLLLEKKKKNIKNTKLK